MDIAERVIDAGIAIDDYDSQFELMEKLIKEHEGKPHKWESGEYEFNPKNFTTGDWESPEAAKERLDWWKRTWEVRSRVRDSISASSLKDDDKRKNMAEFDKTLAAIPVAAISMLSENLEDIRWYHTTGQLTHAVLGTTSRGVVGGAWAQRSNGTNMGYMMLDGDRPGLKASGIYAHEIGHAIDWIRPREEEVGGGAIHHRGRHISSTDEWKAAFDAELKDKQLTDYASTNESEGFAEFTRYLFSGLRPRAVREEFPKCYAVFKKHGYAK